MGRWVHFGPLLCDISFRVDEKSVAVGDLESGVVAQGTVGIHDGVVGVGEQAEGQSLLRAELLVAVGRVHADAHNDRILRLILRQVALEVMSLKSAARSHVLGVEVEYDPFAAKAPQRYLGAIL